MEKFKTYFEETEIESLEALIANPDPSRVKMYGGGTAYVDMLKRKLEKAKESNPTEDEEVEELKEEELINKYNDFGIKYKGYHLEVEQDEEPNERYFYYGTIFNPKGEKVKLPPRKIGGGSEDFITTMGYVKEKEFKEYIDSISAVEEDAQDRCKRKADQVYGKKTSAYKSGAIVRCRQGKIWKKK